MDILKIKCKLITEWKQAWKYLSVQLAAILVFLPTLLPYMPELAQYMPTNWYQFLGMAILAARVIQQKVVGAKNDEVAK